MYKPGSGKIVVLQMPSGKKADDIGTDISDTCDEEEPDEFQPEMVFPGRSYNSQRDYLEVRLDKKRKQFNTPSTRYRTIKVKFPKNKYRNVPVTIIPKKTY